MVSFKFSEEQVALRDAVRQFMTQTSSSSDVRRLMETEDGYDATTWHQMATQLELQGLAISEQFGGSGYGWTELIVVFEELGRALAPLPYFSTIALAATALAVAEDDDANAVYLPGIASGETVATVAYVEDDGRWDATTCQTRGVRSGDSWTLEGKKSYVIDGAAAHVVLVFASTDAGLSLFAVDGQAPGLLRRSQRTLDPTRKLADLQFAATPARLIGAEGSADRVLTKVRDYAVVALAAEQVGGAQRCLEMSVDYAKLRHQFGRPIGSFQAIKHMCADMLVDVEAARSAAYYAGWAAAEDNDEFPAVASLAKAVCSDNYFRAASNTIQIHGGMGFTWEHDAHLYFKRAKASQLMFGDSSYHREQLADRIAL